MKKFLLLICIAIFGASNSNATHLMGGDLRVVYDSASNGRVLRLTHYRDILGVPASASVSCEISITIPGTNALVSNATGMLMPDYANGYGTLLAGIPYGVEVYNYATPVEALLLQYPNMHFTFYVTECCRNGAILNLSTPLTESFTLTADYYNDSLTTNVNPVYVAEPIIYGPINQVWNYNPFPYDADGDSLVWQLDTPLSFHNIPLPPDQCVGYTTPAGSVANPYTQNTTTGEITWEPTVAGNYVASFKVSEYRNGVFIGSALRDMQYVVLPDTSTNGSGGSKLPQFITGTTYQTNSTNKTKYIYYYPGTPLQFDIFGEDLNLTQNVTMTAISNLISIDKVATFDVQATGSGNQIRGRFKWSPKLTETKNQMVVFRLNDGVFNNDFTLVLLKADAPLATSNIVKSTATMYPNPVKMGGDIHILLDNANSQKYLLRITDVQGKMVFDGAVNANNGNITINNSLNIGLYNMQIISEEGVSESLQLQVQ